MQNNSYQAGAARSMCALFRTLSLATSKGGYLPPYSPDLNPIELALSEFHILLQDGAQRTANKLEQLCGQVLDMFAEHECRNYLKHCGYRYS